MTTLTPEEFFGSSYRPSDPQVTPASAGTDYEAESKRTGIPASILRADALGQPFVATMDEGQTDPTFQMGGDSRADTNVESKKSGITRLTPAEFFSGAMPLKEAEPIKSPTITDYGKQLLSGVASGVGMIPQGAGELLTRGINKVAGTELRAENPLQGAIDWLNDSQSPGAKQAIADSQISGNILDPSTYDFGKNPTVKGIALQGLNAIGQFAPNLAISIATAGASLPVQLGIGALVGGMQGMGGGADEERTRFEGMTDAELRASSQLYNTLIDKGVRPSEAQHAVAEAAALGGGLGNAIPSAGEGAFENFLVGALTRGKVKIPAMFGTGLAGKVATGVVGGGTMGGSQEALEQATQNYGSNLAVGGNRPLGEGTLQQFVMGFLAEGTAGGGGAIATHHPNATVAPSVDAEQDRLLDTRLSDGRIAFQDGFDENGQPKFGTEREYNAKPSDVVDPNVAALNATGPLPTTDIATAVMNAESVDDAIKTATDEALRTPVSGALPSTQEAAAVGVQSAPAASNEQATYTPEAMALGKISQAAPDTRTTVDRRADNEGRKRVDALTLEEARRELRTSEVIPELENRRAFDDDERTAAAPVIGYADGDNFKAINSALGHESADVVLRGIGSIFQEAANQTGAKAYHRSGDEFLFRFDSPTQADAFREKAAEIAANKTLIIQDPEGKTYEYRNPGFSIGIGGNLHIAERDGDFAKQLRTDSGERSDTGQTPRGFSPVAAGGEQSGRIQVAPEVGTAANDQPTYQDYAKPDGSAKTFATRAGADLFARSNKTTTSQFEPYQHGDRQWVLRKPDVTQTASIGQTESDTFGNQSALFSRPAEIAPQGMTRQQLMLDLNKPLAAMSGQVNVHEDAASAQLANANLPDGATAWYSPETRQIHLVASRIASPTMAEAELFHEVFHAGVHRQQFQDVHQAINKVALNNKNVRDAANAWMTRFGEQTTAAFVDKGLSPAEAARQARSISYQEALADLSGANAHIAGVGQVIAAVQSTLRKIGLNRLANWMEGKTNAEALQLIRAVREVVMDRNSTFTPTLEQELATRLGLNAEPQASVTMYSRPNAATAEPSAFAQTMEHLKSAGTVRGATTKISDLLHSDATFNRLTKNVNTQFHKATQDADFKRVFDAIQNGLSDTEHFAIESEKLAPDVLIRMEGVKDIGRALLQGGNAHGADMKAIAGPLFANIEGKPGVQQHVFTNEELKADWNLTDRQIDLYRQHLAATAQSVERVAQAQVMSIAEALGINVTAFKNLSLADTVGPIRATMDERMKSATATQAESIANVSNEIDTIERNTKSLIAAGYTPAMRFGEYAVRAEKDGQTVYYGMFEGQLKANAMYRALMKENPDWKVTKGKLNPDAYKMFKGVSPDTFALIAQLTGKSENSAVKEYIALARSSRSIEKRLLERQGIAGFSQDPSRVLAAFVTSNARAASQAINSGDISRAYSAIPAHKGDVQKEAQDLITYIHNPNEEASKLRSLLFMHYMGGSVAAGLVNLTQPVLQTAPFIAQYLSGTQTFMVMKSATKAVATGRIPERYKDAYAKAEADGITDPHEIHQLMADATGSVLGRSLRARAFVKAWGGFFALSEAFNRKVTFLAAYETAEKMGMDKVREAGFSDAYSFAKNAIIETQGLYNKGNRPNWARGSIGATLFVFKQFSIAYLEWFSRLPRQQQLVAIAVLLAASGLQGLPFAEDLEDLIDTLGHRMGYATNSRKELRLAIASAIGPGAAELALYGSSRLTGLDLSSRLGMGNLIPGSAFFDPANKSKGKEVLEAAGAAGGFAKGLTEAMDGNISNTLPTAIRNVVKAYEMATTGEYKDTKGRKVMAVDGWDVISKAVGFQPTDVASASKKMADAMNDLDIARYAKGEIADRWIQGIMEKKPELLQEARRDLTKWNMTNPEMRIQIRPTDIERRVKEATLTRDQRVIKSAPKALRHEVMADLQ